jgi:hypothetical protein
MVSEKAKRLALDSGGHVGNIFVTYSSITPQLQGVIRVLKRPYYRLGELIEAVNTCNKMKTDTELILEAYDYWCKVNASLVSEWKEDEDGLGGSVWAMAEQRQQETKAVLESINQIVEMFSELRLQRI